MSSNDTHMISLSNYEEWFVLYMDDELTPAQKEMVENFLVQHPQLREELDLLLSTKLPADEVSFEGKADLLSDSMKLNMVDESLLLYIDNELPSTKKNEVEQKIAADDAYRWQLNLLQKTKLDPSEVVAHPNKKELYRHAEKVVALRTWMRVAVAVVLILFASLFFLLTNNNSPVTTDVATNVATPTQPKKVPAAPVMEKVRQKQEPATLAMTVKERQNEPQPMQRTIAAVRKEKETPVELTEDKITTSDRSIETASVDQLPTIKVDVAKLTQQPAVAVNNPVAKFAVTSATGNTFDPKNPEETADLDGDYKNSKRTSAKGFLRKVSRFLERRTGIGTANADNEILVGAVALKLN